MTNSASLTDGIGRAVSLKGLLVGEIAIGTCINMLFNFAFAWLLFPFGNPIRLWGVGGLALDCVPASFVPALMMTVIVSAIMHRRLRAGLRVTTSARLPVRLPRSSVIRGLVTGLLALGLVALPTIGLLSAVWNDSWGWPQLVPFKVIFSMFHAGVMTPIVILGILQHRPVPPIR